MTDIYQAPRAQLTETPSVTGYGSLEKGINGQFQFSINDIMNDAWAKTSGNKGKVWLAFLLYLVIFVPVSIVVPLLLDTVGFPSQITPGEAPTPQFFIGFALNQLITMAVTLPLGAGLFMLGLKLSAGISTSPTEVVSYYHKAVPLMITVVLMYIMIAIGLVLFIIPGIYLAFAYYLSIPLVVEKGLGPWQALEASRKALSKCWFRFVGLGLVLMVVFMLGMIPVFLGTIWTLPLMVISYGVVYRNIFGVESSTAA